MIKTTNYFTNKCCIELIKNDTAFKIVAICSAIDSVLPADVIWSDVVKTNIFGELCNGTDFVEVANMVANELKEKGYLVDDEQIYEGALKADQHDEVRKKLVFSKEKFIEVCRSEGDTEEEIKDSLDVWAKDCDGLTKGEMSSKYRCIASDDWMVEVDA